MSADFTRATRTELLDQAQKTLEQAQGHLAGVAVSMESSLARPTIEQAMELANAQISLGTAWSELARNRWLAERDQ